MIARPRDKYYLMLTIIILQKTAKYLFSLNSESNTVINNNNKTASNKLVAIKKKLIVEIFVSII